MIGDHVIIEVVWKSVCHFLQVAFHGRDTFANQNEDNQPEMRSKVSVCHLMLDKKFGWIEQLKKLKFQEVDMYSNFVDELIPALLSLSDF